MKHKRDILLNEEAYAISVLTNGEKGKLNYSVVPDLSIAARYLYQRKDQKPKEIIETLSSLLRHRDISYSALKWEKYLDEITKTENLKRELFISAGIDITQSEIDSINQISRVPRRRVAFTFLCLAKYYNQKNHSDKSLVFYNLPTIFTLSNTAMTLNQKLMVIDELFEKGIIERLADDATISGYRVKIIDNDSDTAMCVTDMRDLGYQYERFEGSRFTECKLCGGLIRLHANETTEYCNNCATKYDLKYQREKRKRPKLCIVKCIDCGQSFIVDPRAFGIKQRCDDCQKKERRRVDTERKRKIRNELSASI